MLQRDYLLEVISQFVEAISEALGRALAEADPKACEDVEIEISELLELDRDVAMSLAPDSLVTMMVLSGMGDSVAAYVCYALDRLSRVYASLGDEDLAGLRHLQAKAVAESFGCNPASAPEELAALDAELFS